MKIVDYTTFGGASVLDLERAVRAAIKVGYQPIGGPVLDRFGYWTQAMVLYEPKLNPGPG